jgi:hypothetical protein
MWLSPFYLTFLLELLLVFLDPFCFGLFGDFIPKGENVRPKQASGLSLQVYSRISDQQGECEHKIKNGEV